MKRISPPATFLHDCETTHHNISEPVLRQNINNKELQRAPNAGLYMDKLTDYALRVIQLAK